MVELPADTRSANGQRLGVFYGRVDPSIARQAGTLTLDEARRFAVNFAKLPDLLQRGNDGHQPCGPVEDR